MTRGGLAAEIERRLLINYRADPGVVASLLPQPLRPQEVNGAAVVGICLIRLGAVRPTWLPKAFGVRSENAAHRIAVEWDTPGGRRCGVYIPRRDSSARLNVFVGGRLYPGVHHRADFEIEESPDRVHVAYTARDRGVEVVVHADVVTNLGGRLFADVSKASAFFRAGAVGLSPGRDGGIEGLELRTDRWSVVPLHVTQAASSFFDDPARFPKGTIELDCGLLMRRVPALWSPVDRATMPRASSEALPLRPSAGASGDRVDEHVDAR